MRHRDPIVLVLLLAAPARAGSTADWSWRAADEGAPVSWANLDATGGTDLGLGAGGTATVSLPFAFPFDGSDWTEITVSAYGVVVPGSGGVPGARASGECAGDGSVSGALLAPMWSTWDLSLGGTVYARTFDEGVVVEWHELRATSSDTTAVSFGLVLFATGEVAFTWKDSSTGKYASSLGRGSAIGLQGAAGDGVSFGCATAAVSAADDGAYFSPWGLRHFAGELVAADEAASTLLGGAASDRFGQALATAGDADGDGADDLVVGAPQADGGASNGGAVYLFSGADLSGEVGTAEAAWILTGEGRSDAAGTAVASGGDVDGDGLPDVLAGIPYLDATDSNAGGAALFLGAGLSGSVAASDADALLLGEAASDYAGRAVAIAGDFDGDGYADMAVGAPGEDTGGTGSGRVYLVLGGAAPGDTDLGAADASWTGAAAGDEAGATLATAGDPDGDGYDDLLAGAWGNDDAATDAGAFYVLLGDLSPSGTTDLSAVTAILGEAAGDAAGVALAPGGDFDGDGLDDLVAGAHTHGSGTEGAAYAVLGTTGAFPSGAGSAWGQADGQAADRLGAAVTALDIGDERALVAGAYGNSDGAAAAGALYFFAASTLDAGRADPTAAWGRVVGDDDSGYLGAALAAGDFDGNGSADLAAGAWGADGGGSGSGVVYLLAGRPTYPDIDGDGHIAVELGGLDCDDDDAAAGPGITDACNGVDDDCDGQVDEDFGDSDGDGTADCLDTEECDGVDNDGDSDVDEGTADSDGDGLCDLLDSEECDGLDNDGDGTADEDFADTDVDGTADCVDVEECDGLDNDGDGTVDVGWPDTDLDGVADCVDHESCDGLDNDGDGEVDEGFDDGDGDGVADCIDEEECDGLDNDGDGEVDEGQRDTDGDGLCDGRDTETCDDVDNDGDGQVDEGYVDADGDGTADCADGEECDGADNDGDGLVDEGYPDVDGDGEADCMDAEDCDGADNDGDGYADEGQPDADFDGTADCMDAEDCDGIDNDGDGLADEGFPDADGDGAADCIDGEECDGIDNDGDGAADEGYPDSDGDGRADCLDDDAPEEAETDGKDGGCATAPARGAWWGLSLVPLAMRRRVVRPHSTG